MVNLTPGDSRTGCYITLLIVGAALVLLALVLL